MKIKRFFGRDMRQAMARIRDEQGPDAVILSTTEVEGGIEVISAVDYDALDSAPDNSVSSKPANATPRLQASPVPGPEASRGGLRAYLEMQEQRFRARFQGPGQSRPDAADGPARDPVAKNVAPAHLKHPVRSAWSQDPAITQMRHELEQMRQLLQDEVARLAWNDYARRDPVRVLAMKRLRRLGLSLPLVKTLIAAVKAAKCADEAFDQAIFQLTGRLPITGSTLLDSGGVVAMVGPTGVGKTTSIAKLAARYCMRHGPGKVGLITADMHRIGAHRQLATYAQILNVPMRTAREQCDIDAALNGFAERKLVLIDTTGLGQRDARLGARLRVLADDARIRTCLVLSAQAQARVQNEVVSAFLPAKPASTIITKLDECHDLGGVLSAIIKHRLPVSFVSDGQRVPEDLHRARAEALVRYAMRVTRQSAGAKAPAPKINETLAPVLSGYSYA